ncbi:MAG: hypothetical protein AAF830_09175 [Pseudomonadota bacterium]
MTAGKTKKQERMNRNDFLLKKPFAKAPPILSKTRFVSTRPSAACRSTAFPVFVLPSREKGGVVKRPINSMSDCADPALKPNSLRTYDDARPRNRRDDGLRPTSR